MYRHDFAVLWQWGGKSRVTGRGFRTDPVVTCFDGIPGVRVVEELISMAFPRSPTRNPEVRLPMSSRSCALKNSEQC